MLPLMAAVRMYMEAICPKRVVRKKREDGRAGGRAGFQRNRRSHGLGGQITQGEDARRQQGDFEHGNRSCRIQVSLQYTSTAPTCLTGIVHTARTPRAPPYSVAKQKKKEKKQPRGRALLTQQHQKTCAETSKLFLVVREMSIPADTKYAYWCSHATPIIKRTGCTLTLRFYECTDELCGAINSVYNKKECAFRRVCFFCAVYTL